MKRFIRHSVVVLVFGFSLCTGMNSFAQTNLVPDDQEFQALKALYDSLGGPNWTNKTNWPTPGNWPATATAAQMGTWFGVTVQSGDIFKVILSGNNLTGKVPVAISLMSQVTQIQLNANHLSGSLPSSLGSLSKLLWLRFDTNQLTGTVPASLGNLPMIQHLYFDGNALTGTIPPALGNLSSLLVLSLSNNQFTGSIPSSFGGLQNLTSLYLHGNQLTGSVPESLGNLTNLNNLYLRNNQLSGPLPASLGNLTKLKAFFANVNALTGSIPASLGNLTDLEYLHLQQNQLTGAIPSQLGNLSKLLQLYVNQNKLTGELPASLGSLTKLQYLNTFSNQLTGAVPSSFSGLTNLVYLNLSTNKLSGDLPDMFGAMTKLANVDLSGNYFTGAFPSSIGSCALLTFVSVNTNRITSFPASALTLPVLNLVNLENNEVSAIPNFSTHTNKANLSVWLRNNRLDFSQLEPLINAGIAGVVYNPQKPINDVVTQPLIQGSALVLTARPAGAFSSVTWEKQNPNTTWATLTNDEDTNPLTYTRTTATLADEGAYRWRATNTKMPGVSVQSEPMNVKIPARFVLDDLAFQYKYDARRRMTHKKVPGADWVYMVYDDRDRLVMTQDAEQRKTNKWSYTKYDALNRPVMTGVYTHSAFVDQAGMSGLISTTNFIETYNGASATHGYSNVVFPTTGTEVLTVTYYDDYAFRSLIAGGGFDYRKNELEGQYQNPDNAATVAFERVTGQVTGTKIKVLGTTTYLWQANYYDDRYRVVQTIASNDKSGTDCITNIYDFTGQVLKTQSRHTAPNIAAVGTEGIKILRTFKYDHAGRLLKTWHKTGNGADVLLAQNEYNELGQLVTKNLYNTDPVSAPDASRAFKQQLDYRYNIRGWLTRMNNSDVSITENGPRDYFGMNLFYNESVPELAGYQPQFNGNISAMKWSTNLGLGASVSSLEIDASKENAYAFRYDTLNRLKSAAFHKKPSTGWTASTAYHEDNLKYDHNGNIKGLNRTTTEGAPMDRLTYAYSGNQLLKVSDASDKTKGFVDGPSPDNDYTYDANGNMTLDRNKDITAITYNHLNLPDKVTKSTGDYVKYTYDATGRKLSQGVYNASNVLKKKSDYAGEFFYENDTLKFINHEEGRVVMAGTVQEYQYHLKDHLGNVRMTFTTKDESQTATATMEQANAANEQSEFIYYNEAVKVYSKIFDHTNNGQVDNDGYAIRLTGGNTSKIYGLAKSLSVMPGDTIKMDVFAKYVTGTPSSNTWAGDLLSTMTAISANAPGVVVDGGLAGSIGGQSFPMEGYMTRSAENETAPKAYLNWLVFNRQDSLVDFGYIRLTTAALENGSNGAHEHLEKGDLLIREPGYVYIYLSNENENPVEVFFDDFGVEHVKSPVIQMDDYYPFGLTASTSQRENSLKNNFLYSGKERQDELDLGWLDYGARMFQPEIGRWGTIDPLSGSMEAISPYGFALNNPATLVDVLGLAPVYNWEKEIYEENGKEVSWDKVQKTLNTDKSANVLLMSNDLSKDPGGALQTMVDAANENGSITVMRVSNTKDAADQLEKLGATIDNLFIGSHGSYRTASFSIGVTNYSGDNLSKIKNDKNLSRISKLMSENSQIIIQACHAGNPQNKGVELLTSLAVKMRTTVLGNQSWGLTSPNMFGGYFFGAIPYYQEAGDSPGKPCQGGSCDTYSYEQRARAFDAAGKWTKVTYSNGQSKVTTINNVYYTRSGGISYSEGNQ
ncbi:hypothetical protein KK083_20245 [Fulvivirgaceae bacterium PWU4]|uniref:Disease resistance R13L4/SHOC-2-like LRR domain-containing protein n=1 Tax=Chryseosolibacter histidini TaxID=2782349 RepID=A0AAP2DRU4_9BACT|nr:leucine-rich repeat domain-containing protein [Chryseosolibacter histidini]MBT1699239.1 hypothetical protein [Chryseosolibacter histidini]